MKVVIQRVKKASVIVNNNVVSSISSGMLILLGISKNDSDKDLIKMTNKISKLRIFSDENGIMNSDINQVNGEVLVVSQFTLYANVKKGNRPSYMDAAKAEQSEPLYNKFVLKLDKLVDNNVKTGVFGANMHVNLINDGPVTIII
tara:strand:+ start:1593 stop:2027 length:435 start_codon:yes stop_codon:yes gene_type:complete